MKKLICILLASLAIPASAQTLMVAAASDLATTIEELAAAFARQVPGARVKTSLGASGNLFAQVKNGAPFDIFMSADMAYPARLAKEGAADGATLQAYAVGRVVLWTVDRRFDLSGGLRVLIDARLVRVAIANPDVAPYGHAARAALQAHGYWDAVKDKLVIGENIAQAAQFVQTGNAQLGVVSYSTVLGPRMKGVGSYYLIPDDRVAPIEQGAIVTRKGQGNPLSGRFMQFLQSPAAREILLRHGFSIPRAKHA